MTGRIELPPPQKDLPYPLIKALEERRTKRKWAASEFSNQELSDLLWAACGISREGTGKSKCRRTAPSACNSQEIRVYAALPSGLFLYEEKGHCLKIKLPRDIREDLGTQKMMKAAPAGLIYVSDFSRFKKFIFGGDENRKWFISAADAGFIGQNVYLFAAAVGWNTALLSLVDREKLHRIMGLEEHEKIVFVQIFGKTTGKDGA